MPKDFSVFLFYSGNLYFRAVYNFMKFCKFSLILLQVCLSALLVSCFDSRSTVEKANEEGILILGNGSEPKALDPHIVNGVIESNILRALFEGLCIEDPSDDSASLPGAALSWEPNADFTKWTFKLNPLGTWSDGVPVTAADFLFSYERILHPEFPGSYASMLYFIKNAEEFNKGEIKDFKEVGVKAIDEFTLEFTLKAPTPFLPHITKHFTWYPVPKHKVLEFGTMTEPFTEWTFEENIVSNGPFMLTEWRRNHYIEATRNPHYWDLENLKLNGVRFLPTNDENTETRMFLNGQIHVTYRMPADFIPTAMEKHKEEMRQELYIGTRFVRANCTREFTNNQKVRHALSLAIDRESLVKNVLQGGEQVAGSVTPPFGSYKPESMTSFNPEKARELLKEAGFPDAASLPEVTLLSADSASYRRVAEALQAMWREHLGLRVKIVKREWKTYLELRKKLEFDLLLSAWIGDYLDPTTFLDLWIGSNGNNQTGWADDTYDGLLKEAETIQGQEERYKKLLEAEAYVMEALPAIPVHHYTSNYFLSESVENWDPLLLNGHPYKFVELHQKK